MSFMDQLWGKIKMKSLDAARAKINEIWLPNDAGVLTKVTSTADDLNGLTLTTRKFTVYSAVALAKGDLLHISSYEPVNDVFIVEKADADTSGKQAQLIASEVNGGSETSLASDIEELTDLNTNAGEVGDPVYLSATAGSWTLTAPTGADQVKQIVGRIKVKSATVGKIVFNTVKGDLVAIGSSGLQDLSVSIGKLAATLLTGVTTVPMSFETNEQAAVKIYFPFKVTVNKMRGIATKAIAATDAGTITGANSTGNSTGGVITAAASDAINTEYSASPTTNNVVLAESYYKLTAAKSTAGGKVLVTIEWTRTA